MGRRGSGQRGYSLIEALVASLVMAVGALSFIAWQARLLVNVDLSRQRSEALHIAQRDIERVRAAGVAQAALPDPFSTTGGFSVSRQLDDGVAAGTKDLRVTVRWNTANGAVEQVVLRTIVGSNRVAVVPLAADLPAPASADSR